LVQALDQRDAKAREFHRALTEAMSASQTPLTAMLAVLDEFLAEVKRQLAMQHDQEIRGELEQVAMDLADCRQQAEAFSIGWDELAPKVAAWRAGGSPDLLIEYQKKIESLVRGLYRQSGTTLGAAGRKVDAIGRGGSEMTKRNIIHDALLKLAYACDQARMNWVDAAKDAVPANNLELKGLRNAIQDLTPRIEARQDYHRQRLVEHLGKVRAEERTARLQQMRLQLAEATGRHQELSEAYLETDSALSQQDEQLQAELRLRREKIQTKRDQVAKLQRDETALGTRIELVRAARKLSLAGAASYQPLEAVLPGDLRLENLNEAIGLGGGVAVLFAFGVWFASRPKRSSRQPSP
jgi:hypothetical protein